MAGELEEGQTHTNQGSRGSEEEKLPQGRNGLRESVARPSSDLYPPQHQVPVIVARPCPGLQPIRVKESAVGIRAVLVSSRTKPKGASSKTAKMHVGIKQACQQCKAR